MNLRKFLTAGLATAATCLSLCVPVLADDDTTTGTMPMANGTAYNTLTYNDIVANANVNAPAPHITFNAPQIRTTTPDAEQMKYGALQGVAGGLKAVAPTVPNNSTTPFTYTGQLTTDATVFPTAGDYLYFVTEPTTSFSGVTEATDETYLVFVIVQETTPGSGKLEVKGFSVTDPSGNKIGGGTGQNTFDFHCTYNTYSVTLSKITEGTSADKTKQFTFAPTFTTEQNNTAANTGAYSIVKGTSTTLVGYDAAHQTVTTGVTNKALPNIMLANGETATIYGLTPAEVLKITETDGISNGYKVKVSVDGANNVVFDSATDTAAKTAATNDIDTSANHTVTFTNSKSSVVPSPTGLGRDVLPYAVIVGAVALFGFVFFRRKREE